MWVRQCFVLDCNLLIGVLIHCKRSSPFLFIILLIFSDDLEKKLLCGFKLLSISRFLATFPVCSSCCKSSSMFISKTLVSLLKHTLSCESLHSFLYIILQKYYQKYCTYICLERFFFSGFVEKTAFTLISPIKFNGSVTNQSHTQVNSAVTLCGLSHIQDGGRGSGRRICKQNRKLQVHKLLNWNWKAEFQWKTL